MSAPIVLVSCVKTKQDRRCRAGDMYTSALFQKMMAYAQSLKPKRIFILSAKYGLLSPDDMIEPYEQTCLALNSSGSARCGSLNTALRRTAVVFVTRAI